MTGQATTRLPSRAGCCSGVAFAMPQHDASSLSSRAPSYSRSGLCHAASTNALITFGHNPSRSPRQEEEQAERQPDHKPDQQRQQAHPQHEPLELADEKIPRRPLAPSPRTPASLCLPTVPGAFDRTRAAPKRAANPGHLIGPSDSAPPAGTPPLPPPVGEGRGEGCMSASAASRRALRLFVSSSLCLLPSLAAVSRPRFGSPARTPRARATTKSQLPQDSFPPPRAVFRARPPRIGRPRAHARGFDPLPLQTDHRQGHRRPPASHRGEASLDGGRRGFNPDCRTVHTRSKRVPPAPSGSVATDVEPVRPPNPRASRAPAARARRDDPSAIHSATPEHDASDPRDQPGGHNL